MHCPTITELPAPPEGKTGWPWTEDSPHISENLSDGREWARVSIVTPSFNQGKFIEETIRSVLLQGYPDLEYIIIDGGSTDDTLTIIRKYERWITFWVSEPDSGQTHAINKGFKKSSGVIVAWLNSDDVYTKGAISKAVDCFSENSAIALCYGHCIVFNDETGETVGIIRSRKYILAKMIGGNYIAQPAAFFKKEVIKDIGYLDENLHYAMDYDLLLKIGLKYETKSITDILAKFRLHDSSKTVAQEANFLPDEFFVIDNLLKNYFSRANLDTQKLNGEVTLKNEMNSEIVLNNEPNFSGEKLYPNTMLDQLCIISAYTHMIRNVIRYSNQQVIIETEDLTNGLLTDSWINIQNLDSEHFFYYMSEKVHIDLTKTNMSESEYYAIRQCICHSYYCCNQRYGIIQNEKCVNSPDSQWVLDQQLLLLHIIFDSKNKSLSQSYCYRLIKDNPHILLKKRMLIFFIKYIVPIGYLRKCHLIWRKFIIHYDLSLPV